MALLHLTSKESMMALTDDEALRERLTATTLLGRVVAHIKVTGCCKLRNATKKRVLSIDNFLFPNDVT